MTLWHCQCAFTDNYITAIYASLWCNNVSIPPSKKRGCFVNIPLTSPLCLSPGCPGKLTKMMIVGYSSLSPANADTGLRYMVLNNVTEESRDTICTVQRSGQHCSCTYIHACVRACVLACVRTCLFLLRAIARLCVLHMWITTHGGPTNWCISAYMALYHDIGVGRTVKLSEWLDQNNHGTEPYRVLKPTHGCWSCFYTWAKIMF